MFVYEYVPLYLRVFDSIFVVPRTWVLIVISLSSGLHLHMSSCPYVCDGYGSGFAGFAGFAGSSSPSYGIC